MYNEKPEKHKSTFSGYWIIVASIVLSMLFNYLFSSYFIGDIYVLKSDDIKNWQPVIEKLTKLEKEVESLKQKIVILESSSLSTDSNLNAIIKQALDEYYQGK